MGYVTQRSQLLGDIMTEARDPERIRNITRAIRNTKDVKAIEDRKIAATRRLHHLHEKTEPLEFAETHFER